MSIVDDRKLKILAAVVDEYVRTGEPVGSKSISKLENINVSSATIRNDMAALEQLGYLEQPHTSAGRIPTFKGYRLYIDELMTPHDLPEEEKYEDYPQLENGVGMIRQFENECAAAYDELSSLPAEAE